MNCTPDCPATLHFHAGNAMTRVANEEQESVAWFVSEVEAARYVRLSLIEDLEDARFKRWLNERDALQRDHERGQELVDREGR